MEHPAPRGLLRETETVAETGSAPVCLNCGERLLGDFCWRCGQEAADFHRPLRSLASDFLDNVLSLDSKLLRTIVPLLFRPGWLTREYLAGRRAPYVRPLKLYLLAALLAFGVLTLFPHRVVRVVNNPPAQESGSGATAAAASQAEKPPNWLDQIFGKALEDPQKFAETFTANLPRAFFLLLPVFALMLKLLYPRRGFLYLDHLVFALHCHAFGFLIMAVMVPLGDPRLIPRPLRAALLLWLFGYLFLALRAVYRDSWLKAGLRLAALMVLYNIVFLIAVFTLMLFTAYWVQR